ncbi:MAG TPA: FecR domain-containing protein [Polyangiaceae bacterium]
MSPKQAERALRQLVTEVRSEPTPELDWAALEARLPSGPVTETPRKLPRARILLAAAGIALVAGALGLRGGDTPAPVALPADSRLPGGPSNGDTLALGTTIVTQAEARTVEHAGHARWKLHPHGSAKLVTRGDRVIVRLESGTLEAHIVPSTRPETFAVEAADVRVAAHGTVFHVALEAGAVAVSVVEGTVLVGPRATPGVGKLLSGPSAGRFTLAGKPAEEKPASPPSRTVTRGFHPGNEPATPGSASPAGSAEPATPQAVEQALSRVVELASRCFSERTSASDGVRVTAHTALTFQAAPDGAIRSIHFDPPLAPNVQACIDQGARAIEAARSSGGLSGSRVVDLER